MVKKRELVAGEPLVCPRCGSGQWYAEVVEIERDGKPYWERRAVCWFDKEVVAVVDFGPGVKEFVHEKAASE